MVSRMEGWTEGRTNGMREGQTDEWTDGADKNYILFRHTLYARGLIMVLMLLSPKCTPTDITLKFSSKAFSMIRQNNLMVLTSIFSYNLEEKKIKIYAFLVISVYKLLVYCSWTCVWDCALITLIILNTATTCIM